MINKSFVIARALFMRRNKHRFWKVIFLTSTATKLLRKMPMRVLMK